MRDPWLSILELWYCPTQDIGQVLLGSSHSLESRVLGMQRLQATLEIVSVCGLVILRFLRVSALLQCVPRF